jgi:release factor glutamine methyltransferase
VPDLPADVADWEPRQALVSGPSGLEAIEAIVAGARDWLDPAGGALVVELAPHQAAAAVGAAAAAGFDDVVIVRDLADRDRVLVARVGVAE